MIEQKQERVCELRLHNYKSVAGAIIAFQPLTILTGPNGAGKSNILDALGLLSDAMSLQLSAALDARGGVERIWRKRPNAKHAPRFGLTVHLQLHLDLVREPIDTYYGFEVKAVAHQVYAISRERCYIDIPLNVQPRKAGLAKALLPTGPLWFERTERSLELNIDGRRDQSHATVEPHALLLPLLSGNLFFSSVRNALSSLRCHRIAPGAMCDLSGMTPGHGLAPDGRNAASLVAEMQRSRPQAHALLCSLLQQVAPDVIRVEGAPYGSRHGLHVVQKRWESDGLLTLEAAAMSSGTLHALGILLALLQEPRPLLVAIEEPETGLHPGALAAVMEIIQQMEQRPQLVLTTHSPDVLHAPGIGAEAIRLVQMVKDSTVVTHLPADLSPGAAANLLRVGAIRSVGESVSAALQGEEEVPG